MISIRFFAMTDLEDITELMSDWGYPTDPGTMERRMKQIQSNPANVTFVAEWEGEVVGMVGLHTFDCYGHDGTIAKISPLVTKKAFQGKGIGKALVTHVEQWAKSRGCISMTLNSGNRPERLNAHRFYMNLGYQNRGFQFTKTL